MGIHTFPFFLQAFVETWEELDSLGTGFIDATSLTTLLGAISAPMGVKGLDHLPRRIQEIVQESNIPLRSKQVGFLETRRVKAGIHQ